MVKTGATSAYVRVMVTQPFSYPGNQLPARAKSGETTAILGETPLYHVNFCIPVTLLKSEICLPCTLGMKETLIVHQTLHRVRKRLVDADT